MLRIDRDVEAGPARADAMVEAALPERADLQRMTRNGVAGFFAE